MRPLPKAEALKTLLVALGNPYRRDDGAAWRLAAMIGEATDKLTCTQLTPELALDIAGYQRVVFADADLRAGPVRLERVAAVDVRPTPLGHALSIEEVVALARSLFGFRGEVWVCRIPGEDFADGEGLSDIAAANVVEAARLLQKLWGRGALEACEGFGEREP